MAKRIRWAYEARGTLALLGTTVGVVILLISRLNIMQRIFDFDQPYDNQPHASFRRDEDNRRLENDLQKVRELSAKGKHLEAGILLMELADSKRTASGDEKNQPQPDLLELEALSELTLAGQDEGYRNALKLKYPEWDGRNSPIFDYLAKQEGKQRRVIPRQP